MLHYICLVECIMDCIIWVLLRSDCHFTKKAWNAQNAGAAAILVADDKDEPLIAMDTPEESGRADYLENITIPSALITKSVLSMSFGPTVMMNVAQNATARLILSRASKGQRRYLRRKATHSSLLII